MSGSAPPDKAAAGLPPPRHPTAYVEGPTKTTDTVIISGPVAGLRRRRAASRRLPPLGGCGCIRDPLSDRHRCRALGPTQQRVDAYRHTIAHLLALGLTPAPLTVEARALWQAGGHDRRLINTIAAQWDLAG